MQLPSPERNIPTFKQSAWFRMRVTLLQCQRGLFNCVNPVKKFKPNHHDVPSFTAVSESRSVLFSETSIAEQRLQLGKIHNLRIALRQIDGITIPAGETFSFWRQIGRATKQRGFKPGRELREGCIIPSTGGGICQISNALYELALRSGCKIIERHPHTHIIPGSASELNRDATVAWNHIDLRFAPPHTLHIKAKLTQSELVIQFLTSSVNCVEEKPPNSKRKPLKILENDLGSCMTCGESGCHRHSQESTVEARKDADSIAYIVDAVTPEFSELLESRATSNDVILAPLDGHLLKLPRYQLPPTPARAHFASIQALNRAIRLRGNVPPPVSRRIVISSSEQIARALAKKIPYDCRHLIIDIKLLNGLNETDELGNLLGTGLLFGRTFSVFLSRMPMSLTQAWLDEAALRVQAPALSDFRVPENVVRKEEQALSFASELITPHPFLARHFSESTSQTVTLIPYKLSSRTTVHDPDTNEPYLYFPGPTAARKGAHAVREVARATGLPVAVSGKNLESTDFWDGINVLDPNKFTYHHALAVLAPSALEDRPSRLLQAFIDGTPIITTPMAGLPEASNVFPVEFNNVDQIVHAIERIKSRLPSPL